MTPCPQLLAALASFDLTYLLTMLLEGLRRLGLETRLHIQLFPFLLYPLNAIAMTGSIFMTVPPPAPLYSGPQVGVAVERYIAVYHPLYYNKVEQCTRPVGGCIIGKIPYWVNVGSTMGHVMSLLNRCNHESMT